MQRRLWGMRGNRKMKFSIHSHRRILLAASAVVLALPVGALAQDKSADTTNVIQDIVVTARKREERLQSTPVSVAAFSADTLTKQGVDDFSEIASRVPGFTLNPDNITEPNIFLRGIGTDIESAAANPAVGFFLNDVYLSRAQGTAMELFDLERVEVVRGPQGTLYGKNVVGGAINFVTKKPTEELTSSIEGTVGDYKTMELKASISGGLAENLSGSLAASARSHGGYAYNTYTKSDMEDLSAFGVLAQLRYQPSSDLDILLTGDLTRHRGGGHWIDIQIPSTHNIPFVNPDHRRGANNIDGKQDADLGGVHLTIDKNLGAGRLSSITAYREARFQARNNDAGSYIDFTKLAYTAGGRVNFFAINGKLFNDDYYINDKDETAKTFSQELRYASDLEGPFNFMTGLYYLHEDVDRTETADYIFVDYYAQGTEIARTRMKSDTYAAFVEGSYEFSDTAGITAGVRYTKDNKTFSAYRETIGDFLGADFEDDAGKPTMKFSANAKESWSAWTPSVNLHWQATQDIYTYALVSKGYKSGGWNGENATNPGEARNAYDPEFAWNYELGFKSDWFGHRLRANATGFWTEYDDLQTQQFVIFDPKLPADNVIANAGKARVKGVELETIIAPTRGLTLYGNYTYMKGEITGDLISTRLAYSPACFCSVPIPTNLKGNPLRRTPKNSFNVGGSFDRPVGDKLNVFVRANYSYTGSFEFDNETNPRTHQDSVGLVNGSVGFGDQDGNWELSLWGKNLGDELYETGKSDVIGSVLVSYGAPRTYGVTLRWKH
jgi:iron complex outermembrane receptor protein